MSLIAFKDFLFRNASFGKKIMGLVILDDKSNVPSLKIMIKRGFLMPTLGYVIFVKSIFTGDDFKNWELDKLKTKVVPNKKKEI